MGNLLKASFHSLMKQLGSGGVSLSESVRDGHTEASKCCSLASYFTSVVFNEESNRNNCSDALGMIQELLIYERAYTGLPLLHSSLCDGRRGYELHLARIAKNRGLQGVDPND